ncbi:MAG: O-antigen ligase family protein [Anaerolineae bacterium]|nr:O-antigen ligase family protein [Anaerolineae bacterium]
MPAVELPTRLSPAPFWRGNPLRHAELLLALVGLLTPLWLFSTYLPRPAPWIALGGLFLLFLGRSLALRRWHGHTPADAALLLLALTLPVGLWASADRGVSLPRVWAFVANLALFWALAAQAHSRWLRHAPWGLLLAGLGLAAALLLGTNFGGNKLPFIQADFYSLLPGGWRPFWNPAGFNPNLSGGLLALFWAPAVMLTLAPTRWPLRLLAAFTTLLLTALLLLAQSRGALLGAAIALPVMTVLYRRRWLWVWLLLLAVGLTWAWRAGISLSPDTLLGQSAVLGASSLQGRIELWSRALYILQDFAFTGVGLGMVQPVVNLLYPLFTIGPDAQFLHAHNIYLQTGAEMGFPGLIAHLALYLTLLALLLAAIRRTADDPQRQALLLGLLGALLIFLLHGCFEVITYATRAAIVVWAFFGLIVAAATPLSPPSPLPPFSSPSSPPLLLSAPRRGEGAGG